MDASTSAGTRTSDLGAKQSPHRRDPCRRDAATAHVTAYGDLLFSSQGYLGDPERAPALRGRGYLFESG
jgi:hypothetical protein